MFSKEIFVTHSLNFLGIHRKPKILYFVGFSFCCCFDFWVCFFFNNTMENTSELWEDISIKDSRISVICKNIMKKKNVLIHFKTSKVYVVVHKYLKWIINPLIHTFTDKASSPAMHGRAILRWWNHYHQMK